MIERESVCMSSSIGVGAGGQGDRSPTFRTGGIIPHFLL